MINISVMARMSHYIAVWDALHWLSFHKVFDKYAFTIWQCVQTWDW